MTVTFCGHSDIDEEIAVQIWLDKTIRQLCLQGAKQFLLGGYGRFDGLAAAAVRRIKPSFPDISSILVLPYLDRKADTTFYDASLYPPLEGVPKRFAIPKRNEWMVDASDVVVAYVLHNWGGAAKTFAYALRKKKTVICFANTQIMEATQNGKAAYRE